MIKKARLLFTNDCNRNCRGCCNKNWTGEPAREITLKELRQYDEVYITGGEPMLYPDALKSLIKNIRTKRNKIFLYTAQPYPKSEFLDILSLIDGCSVTIHNNKDAQNFVLNGYHYMSFPNKSMRLNVFLGRNFKVTPDWDFRVKSWIENAPLPDGEEFVKLK